jgi:RNA polymerase sigma factor FliA
MEDRRTQEDRRAQGDRRGLQAYQTISGAKKRDEMVKKYLGLVSFVASRLAIGLPNWIDKRDLISAGVIGLIDAVNNFDPAKGVKFESYATTRIRGAMIDELRSLDWIPRSTRMKSKEIESAIAALIGKLGRFPSEEEIAGELEWELDKYYKTIGQVAGTTLLSLDEMVEYQGGESVKRIDTFPGDTTSPLDTIERRELLDNVVKILKSLSEQERLAIALYYYEELTLKEIGLVMNVSESRVSQIHTTAIMKLRVKLRSLYSES